MQRTNGAGTDGRDATARQLAKAAARAEWKRIEARVIRALAVQCRDPAVSHWKPTDIADQLDLEAERREHPEKFKPEVRLPMYHPYDVDGVTEPVAQRPTYDELKNAIIAIGDDQPELEDSEIALDRCYDLAARLKATT